MLLPRVRALADVGDDWAVDMLIGVLCEGRVPRSRVASQLEQLAPLPGARLLPLLRDSDPAVRFWGATLLAPYPGLADGRLVMMAHDRDPNVRAAAVETLGVRDTDSARAAILASIDDPVWYVRVHAARSAGRLLGADAAPSLVRLLSDTRWWVRTAAKDALRGIGPDAVSSLLATLTDEDAFARNGAAEVLQDIGFVDSLAVGTARQPSARADLRRRRRAHARGGRAANGATGATRRGGAGGVSAERILSVVVVALSLLPHLTTLVALAFAVIGAVENAFAEARGRKHRLLDARRITVHGPVSVIVAAYDEEP